MEEKLFPPCPPVVTPEAGNERQKASDPRLTHFLSISADSDSTPTTTYKRRLRRRHKNQAQGTKK